MFRIAVAVVLAIAFLVAGWSVFSASANAPLWASVKVLFSLMWTGQAYFLLRHLKAGM